MKTAAFVPIRLNSQRVSGKNLRPLSGSPLMCHILRTLTEVEGIDEVYVYCSDERIREFLPEGVRFLRRSEELDRDTTLGREIYDSFTAEVEADLYVLAHATSPFIRAETVADALRKVVSGEYDSAFSAEKIQTFAWYEGRPLNYSPENIPRTQTIEPVYIETSAFFIFPRALWTGRHRRIGDRPYMAVAKPSFGRIYLNAVPRHLHLFRCGAFLFGSEQAVSGVAESGHDISVLVEAFIESRRVNINVRMIRLNLRNAFGSRHKAHKTYRIYAFCLKHRNCIRSGAAGCKHGINDYYDAFSDISRKLAVIFHRKMSFGIAIKSDMPDFCNGDEAKHTVNHSQTGTEDRDNRKLFSGYSLCLHRSNGSFYHYILKRKVAGDLISH